MEQQIQSVSNGGIVGHVNGLGKVSVPDKQFPHCPEDNYVRLVHGKQWIIAVFNNQDECLGWVVKE